MLQAFTAFGRKVGTPRKGLNRGDMTKTPSGSTAGHRLLLIHATDPAAPSGGRTMLSHINARLLRDLFGDDLIDLRMQARPGTPSGAIRGHIDGIEDTSIARILATLDAARIDVVFIDGSNLGAAAAAIKAARPAVRVVTFFHNVEARFFWGSMRERRTLKSLAVLAANYIAERKAVRSSDVRITLSARDSAGLRRLYGRAADVVAPIVLEDKGGRVPSPSTPAKRAYVLFVGGGFYANIAGIDWFVRAVAPRIGLHVMIVGRGMETLAARFDGNASVTLVGAVDDLSQWYADATVVIAPIFDGSGMKTKVAEALMFGKHVIGTPEAFSGYAQDVVAANRCCADDDTFVAALALAEASPPPAFDPAMRALYERDHSPAAARTRLAGILRVPDQPSTDQPSTDQPSAP
jgi:glycosyltransferase involved in cell wall biosynthesis